MIRQTVKSCIGVLCITSSACTLIIQTPTPAERNIVVSLSKEIENPELKLCKDRSAIPPVPIKCLNVINTSNIGEFHLHLASLASPNPPDPDPAPPTPTTSVTSTTSTTTTSTTTLTPLALPLTSSTTDTRSTTTTTPLASSDEAPSRLEPSLSDDSKYETLKSKINYINERINEETRSINNPKPFDDVFLVTHYNLFLKPDYVDSHRFCSNIRNYSKVGYRRYVGWGALLTGVGILGVAMTGSYLARAGSVEAANVMAGAPDNSYQYNPAEPILAVGTALSAGVVATGIYLISRGLVAQKQYATAELYRARVDKDGKSISDEEAFRQCALVRQGWMNGQTDSASDLLKTLQGIQSGAGK